MRATTKRTAAFSAAITAFALIGAGCSQATKSSETTSSATTTATSSAAAESPTTTAPSAAAMAAIRAYIDAFNKGDPKAMTAVCADPMQILDGMSPHVWQGPTASEDWWRDVLAENERVGASGNHITLAEPPRHADITGDYAYIVLTATYSENRQGKQVTVPGLYTVVLRKVGPEWRLTAWAWTKDS